MTAPRSRDLRVAFVTSRRVSISSDGAMAADAGLAKVIEAISERVESLHVVSPIATGRYTELVDTRIEPSGPIHHRAIADPGRFSISISATRGAQRVIGSVESQVDATIVQVGFLFPFALLPVRGPRVYHVVGDPLSPSLGKSYRGSSISGFREIVGHGLDRFQRWLCARPNSRAIVHGGRLAARYPNSTAIVSSSLWKSEIDALINASRSEEPDGIGLIFVGHHWQHYKGLDVLLAAYLLLIDERPDLRLTIVGGGDDGDLSPGTRALLREAQRRGQVELTGALPGHRVADHYRKNDIIVLPSRSSEGTPRVLVEAAASGCAVVATDVCGIPSMFGGGKEALLVEPDDSATLAEVLRDLLEDPDLRTEIARAGQIRAASYSVESMTDAIVGAASAVVKESMG